MPAPILAAEELVITPGKAVSTEQLDKLGLTEAEKAWVASHPVMRLGVDAAYPPFDFIAEDGTYSGMASDYARIIGERLGIKMVVMKGLSWGEVVNGVKNRTVDMLPAISQTEDRSTFMAFSREHLVFPDAIFMRKDHPLIAGPPDLQGRKVAFVKSYGTTEIFKKNWPETEFYFVDSPLEALRAVSEGRAEATLRNLGVGSYLINKHNFKNLVVAAPGDMGAPGLSFGIRKDWAQLAPIIDKVLDSITPEQEAAIREKWGSTQYQIGIDIDTVKQVAWQASVAVAVILIIIMIWNRRLQAEVKQRIQAEKEMEAAKNEAEAAARAKSEFVAVVSHEVRTPMNGVLGIARLLLETPLLPEQREYAENVVESGEALMIILNDLLDISKLEAGKLDIETAPFTPAQMITDTVIVMASNAREKGLKLICDIDTDMPAVLVGDVNRIRQVLFNLLSNAIKFTTLGSITVAAKGTQNDNGLCAFELSVADTGIGINEEEKEKLFAPYVQANVDVARRYGGTGLGLSICRHLVELMGGEIQLDSIKGKGSTFTFSVALNVGEEKDIPTRPARTEADLVDGVGLTYKPHILLVEDNYMNRKVALGFMRKIAKDCAVTENGQEALDLISKAEPFDVILMDRHMPVMDGIEATRKIRAMEGPTSRIPIIGLTAAATSHEIQTCLEAGMNDVVTKPINPRELREAVLRLTDPEALRQADGKTPVRLEEPGEPADPEPAAAPAEDAQSLFLAKVGHNLRGSLNRVLGHVSMLEDGSETPAEAAALEDHADGIRRESQRLIGVSEDVLTLLQLETGIFEPQKEPIDASALLETCLDRVSQAGGGHEVAIQSAPPPAPIGFEADTEMARQAMVSVLSNAVDASPDPGLVEVSISTSVEAVIFTVSDRSDGLTAEDIARIGEPYGRIWEDHGPQGDVIRRYVVADRLMVANGGRQELEAETDLGTTARLVFPYSTQPEK